MNKDEEIVCYILIRKDLSMSIGKAVAQGAHAVHLMLNEMNNSGRDKLWLNKWEQDGITKITLAINSENELWGIIGRARQRDNNYTISHVVDEGRTEVPENSLTAACLQPMPRKLAKPLVGHLRLL